MITKNHAGQEFRVISRHTFLEVRLNISTNQQSLHSLAVFNPGDVIMPFSAGSTHSIPTYLTVQTGINKHITLSPEYLQYINHSCSPNVFFDTHHMQLICLQQLQPEDELRFFYPSTEWDMAQPFVCNCGSSECLQLINGAAHLSTETLSKYRLSHFITTTLKQKV
ncbi:MAG TPA: SET domain-containing protein-lysine N-methyltransferase [Ferruginibacter sp.]|nr:SET domain-containing protein-lysine N-methyltransferase [Ferruginibacter sp.]HMP19884.1 SET domain-containing protein-lysine N-methyltransferase [Ferruginibacter sp.]